MTELERCIAQLHSLDYAERKAATTRLAALGEAAVPALIEVACSTKIVARIRAIEALGQIGDRRAFWPLLELPYSDSDFILVHDALQAILNRLEESPQREDIPLWLVCLQRFRYDVYNQPLALTAARSALKLAQTKPCAELLPLLPLLKATFFSEIPYELTAIRKELLHLLADWKDLPVVAEAPPKEARDLPLPSQEHS